MTDHLQAISHESLAKVTNGAPAAEILADICAAFESGVPGTTAGVTILDRTARMFEHAIFPSLSPNYGAALQGIAVADKPGSCALAVFDGKTVICEDVITDDRFSQGWKELGTTHGLKALVSIPAYHRDAIALGTFVVAWTPEHRLTDEQMKLAEQFAELCALILTYRRNQLRNELIIGELQHRVRNLFSTIGAVVYATLKSHPEPDVFRKAFDGRLVALARAHSLALEAGEAELRELLADTLAPYSIDHDVSLDGPRLILTQEAAVAFSLAAHELATNAAKYGAFSRNGGSVRIGWDFSEKSDGDPSFELTWQESGGPAVRAPERQGYGQTTLRRSLESAIDGKVDLDYQAAGLLCRVVAPNSPRLGVRVS